MDRAVSERVFAEESLDLLIEPDVIHKRIQEVASALNQKYEGERLSLVMVMKGSICLAADLIRHLNVPCTIDYVRASSYSKTKKGELKVDFCEGLNVTGKNVLLIDDIFDTGHTLTYVCAEIEKQNPKNLETLVLLVKDVPREITTLPDYVLFTIPNRFVIGFGLDYEEFYRGLPGIYAFPQDTPPTL